MPGFQPACAFLNPRQHLELLLHRDMTHSALPECAWVYEHSGSCVQGQGHSVWGEKDLYKAMMGSLFSREQIPDW